MPEPTTVQDLIDAGSIILELASVDRDAAILELAGRLVAAGRVDDAEAVTAAALEREAIGSTNIGLGVAIPHAKSSHVLQAAFAFGRRSAGVRWPGEAVADAGTDPTADEEKEVHQVDLIFLIASPEQASDEHLRILAALARALMHDDFRDALRRLGTPTEILDLLTQRLTVGA